MTHRVFSGVLTVVSLIMLGLAASCLAFVVVDAQSRDSFQKLAEPEPIATALDELVSEQSEEHDEAKDYYYTYLGKSATDAGAHMAGLATKFRFEEKVKITGGFWRGREGRVMKVYRSYANESHVGGYPIQYTVAVDFGEKWGTQGVVIDEIDLESID